MATLITRYVHKGSPAGGNGTTNATSGANRAYASLTEWEAAEQKNLVTADEIHIVYCDGGKDGTYCSVIGWTTDATRTITIEGNASNLHNGTPTTSAYYMAAEGSNWRILNLQEDLTIRNLQFKTDTNFGSINMHRAIDLGNTTYNIKIEKCVFWMGSDYTHSKAQNGIGNGGPNLLKIKNCGFFGFNYQNGTDYSTGISFNSADPGASYIYHNTFYDCQYGLAPYTASTRSMANVRLKNNLFYSIGQHSTRANGGAWHADSDYNVEENASGSGNDELPGANSKHSQTITFIDTGASDYHVDDTDTDAQVSNNLYSDAALAVTDDIDGDARPSTGDVFAGFDGGTTAPVGGISIPIVKHHRNVNFS